MDERTALYLLYSSEELWTNTVTAMHTYAGSYEDALSVSPATWRREGILRNSKKESAFSSIIQNRQTLLDKLKRYEATGIKMVTHLDENFPERLRNIPDPPLLLWVLDDLPGDDIPSVSIVGARECSEYGTGVAEYFAKELAKAGIQVVSGLAYGIDSAAGRGAVNAGGRSFAVLGTGVNNCYPKEMYPLYRNLINGHGGVISEFMPGAPPLRQHFVMRNRIIAGFGDVLLVIEAKEKSGTSITVGYALDQGKDIFALPGRITDPLGYGCNRLLKDGAIPLTSPSDVLEYFGIGENGQMTLGLKDLSSLSPKEKIVWDSLSVDPRHIEDVALRSGMPLQEVLAVLYHLEHKAFVTATGSAYWARKM